MCVPERITPFQSSSVLILLATVWIEPGTFQSLAIYVIRAITSHLVAQGGILSSRLGLVG
jgi:hypothetical protein